MAKAKISEYSATAASNTVIDDIDVDEACAAANINNAIRELMAHLKDWDVGTSEMTAPRWAKGADIASASPLVIDTDGNFFDVTGTTGFSAMTVAAGRFFMLQFDGALTMTSGASLDLGNGNITTAAGDHGLFFATAADTVALISWHPADGQALGVGDNVTFGGVTSGGDILSDTDSADSLGSTAVRWLKGWFDTLTAGTLTIGTGSITDSSGAISFGNENLSTTGTLGSGALTASTIAGTTGTFSGVLSVTDSTDSSSGSTGSIKTLGGLGVVKDAWIGSQLIVGTGANTAAGAILTLGTGAEQLEVNISSNEVSLRAFDRTASAYDNLRMDAATHSLRIGTTEKLNINAAGTVTVAEGLVVGTTGIIGGATGPNGERLSVTTSGSNGIELYNSSTSNGVNNLRFTSADTNAANRNWGIFQNVAAYGDFVFKVGATLGSDARLGTSVLAFDNAGNATFAAGAVLIGSAASTSNGADLEIAHASGPGLEARDTTNGARAVMYAQDSVIQIGSFSNHDVSIMRNVGQEVLVGANVVTVGNQSAVEQALKIVGTPARLYFNTASNPNITYIEGLPNSKSIKFVNDSATTLLVDSTGAVTKPLQPCFNAYAAAASNGTGQNVNWDLTGDNDSTVGVTWTEIFDQGADFNVAAIGSASAGGTFTAPVTGRYYLHGRVAVSGATNTATIAMVLRLDCSNRDYYKINTNQTAQQNDPWTLEISAVVDMDANDTAILRLVNTGEASNVHDIQGGADQRTSFDGFLVA